MVLSMQLPKWIQVYFGSLMTLQELGRILGSEEVMEVKNDAGNLGISMLDY